jgi:conjugative relaxase-like TrwC/TraI family protein
VTADLHKLSAGRADYYVREIAKDREEYLSGQGESPGEWLGGSAAALGMSGVCSAEEFQRVFAWRHPQTGEQLGRAPRSDAMPAWDLVLRPVKDVSVLYGLGDDKTRRAAREAHRVGVAAAVGYLDGQVGTRRGRGGAEHVGGEGLLAVGFTHRVSRAGDPLLHTHLVIVNRTLGPDGQGRTLDSRDLLAHRQAADAIYRAAYQHELTRTLDIRWADPDRWGNRAIHGMPEDLVRAFSKRHEQITAELERLDGDGRTRTGKLIQYVAHATRPPKSHDTPETLYGRWRQEARQRGVDPERLVRQVGGRELREPAVANLAVKRAFNQLASPEGLTANASTFARREVLVALGGQLAAIGPTELGRLADRFLGERAVSVMAEHAAGERRWTTPELLQVEQRLIAAAVDRAGEQTAVASHEAVREALAAHPTIAGEQAAMVRDITQCGSGVVLVVGKAGTGKTYTLGVARHAWQLDGYRVLGAAPTGIAAVCLGAEGFEEVATVDRLLGELDAAGGGRRGPGRFGRGQGGGDASPLDARTVLVVDEAGMLGSRKLARLLDHAEQAGTKVALVGDDRQLAAIEAGGGFRGLRLRLGASVLSENRRQVETWERQAVEHIRNGDLDLALAAYRAHGRMVAAETPTQLKETLLGEWWRGFQQGQRVAILAHRRDEVDQFNTACQQLRQHAGQLGGERLQVGDRAFAVGDLVVCGKNALRSLGVANGSRGQVTAIDPTERRITLQLEDGKQVTLTRAYLDERPRWWTRGNPDRRTLDLGYGTTGHRSQGVTLDRALVRVAGAEDNSWLYVAATRAAKETTFFDVVAPEPRPVELELDVPTPEPRSIEDHLAAVGRRDGGKHLAVDAAEAAPLQLRGMSKYELRAERDRVATLLREAPPDRGRQLARTTQQRQDAEQGLTDATAAVEAAQRRLAERGQGAGRLLRRRELAEARDRLALAESTRTLARQQADRAADRERVARRAQQEYQAWRERYSDLLVGDRARARELAWRGRVDARAVELERPGWLRELGELSATVKGQRAWRQTVARVEQYRERYGITDPERALGPEPRDADLEQRRHHRATQQAIERLQERQRIERQRLGQRERGQLDQPPTRRARADRACSTRVDERERGGREREAG